VGGCHVEENISVRDGSEEDDDLAMDARKIAAVVEKIARSPLSVAEYFKRHVVPFSKTQYFRYKERLETQGLAGLVDGRSQGNHRTLTTRAKDFIRGARAANAQVSLRQLAEGLQTALGLQVGRSTISRFLNAEGMASERPPTVRVETIESACGGAEIIAALALHLGWPQHAAQVLIQERERFRNSEAFREERVRRDQKGRSAGKFTADYNRRDDVRKTRFASVDDKRQNKNYSRMQLFVSSQRILERKCLGILAMPLITLNGQHRSANNPLGNALEHLCGFNYKHLTLDKFLRELKFIGPSEQLLREQIPFWRQHWPDPNRDTPLLCYYVDGNTKALWSSRRVKQNKVTMLGRVMGCLEQVFVHDGFGHPVYMETYAGKAPVGEHVLEMMEKIEDVLEGPGPALKVRRVLVMDAASNGVGTLRAFAAQDKYHYITSLDDNQWSPRKVLEEGRAKRYRHGEATLRDCRMEMEDSREKGYLVDVRAVRIEWDNGKCTTLATSLPAKIVDPSLVVKSYFDRWPCEEHQFREMKHFSCLNRVAGYGMKKIPDEKARENQKKLAEQIDKLERSLKDPLERIDQEAARIKRLIDRERQVKSHGRIVDGKWRLNASERAELSELGRQIAASNRQIKTIEAEAGRPLKRLRRKQAEWLRLQDKDYVYKIDVELDQIMGFFRIALVNVASWFLRNCLGGQPMSLARLFHSVLMLPAKIELTDDVRRVVLTRNHKDPDMMEQLDSALRRLNDLRINDLKGRRIEFQLPAPAGDAV
jgi:transposase